MKKTFITIAFLILSMIPACREEVQEKPNIIIIFTDDQGYADLGCFGAKGFHTPQLDKMASEGIRFTSFYVASPVCSPSRAALLTGSYPVRVGVPAVLGPISPSGLDPSEITIAEILKKQGYATACVGKWHVGDHPSMMPTSQGFDEYFGLPYSNDMWPWHHDYTKNSPPSDLYPDLPLYNGLEVIERNPDQNQLTKRYTDFAIRFIEKNKDRPFFLYLPHSMPHVPLGVSDKFAGKTVYGRYGDVIEEIDWSVGEILQALKDYKLDQRTLVIFTSDNGPWLPYGNHAGKATPLREGKSTTFEGGMRVPCIMRWPGKIPPGQINNELATTMDFLPTIAYLSGSRPPDDRVIDGENIWSLMSGTAGAQSPHKAFFYHFPAELQAVRSGPWKLHFTHPYREQAEPGGINGQPAGQVEAVIGLSLFNLEDDIGEMINVAEQHPEIVKKLTSLADAHLKDLAENSRSPLEISDVTWRRYQDKLSEGTYIMDWWLIGPFDNTGRKGMAAVYEPEKEYLKDKIYKGRNDQKISWQYFDGKGNEYISLAKLFKPSDQGVVYARRTFIAEKAKQIKIGLGTNDGVKMWVNGKLIHTNVVGRSAVPNDDILMVPFKKGENVILLKIDQLGGGWGFYFSILEGAEVIR